MNRPNMLEYYITLDWEILLGTNTPAYWAHGIKISWLQKSPETVLTTLHFLCNLQTGSIC
jgi:hypothetical protein